MERKMNYCEKCRNYKHFNKMDILNNNNENVNKVLDLTLQMNNNGKLRRFCN